MNNKFNIELKGVVTFAYSEHAYWRKSLEKQYYHSYDIILSADIITMNKFHMALSDNMNCNVSVYENNTKVLEARSSYYFNKVNLGKKKFTKEEFNLISKCGNDSNLINKHINIDNSKQKDLLISKGSLVTVKFTPIE